MKKTIVLSMAVFVITLINVTSVVSASTSTLLFFDDFNGTTLDTSLWSVFVDAHGQYHWPYVAGGLLHSQGYHTRIDSITAFAAPETGQSVMARASIRLSGEIQKFGFAPNPNERIGPITGYYFDTLDPLHPSPGREDHVRALAWFQPASGDPVNLLDVEIYVTWYEFHEFAVERTPSEVIYSIDGQEVARVADEFAGALPVGVWNDRWSFMQTDWVEVMYSVFEPPCTKSVLYWTDYGSGKIQSANADGSGMKDLVTTGLVNPIDISVDAIAGKMYFIDYGIGELQRANLDGSEIEVLISAGLSAPHGMDLDTVAGKIYWVDPGNGKIQRSNLDGSSIEDLFTSGGSGMRDITLNAQAGLMYWTDFFAGRIKCANMDGSGMVDLITGLDHPWGIALDIAGGKIYFSANDKIQRANLDGSGIEDLVAGAGLMSARGLALDLNIGKMYWADAGTSKIQSANLDGSDLTDIITDLNLPGGIVLFKRPKCCFETTYTFQEGVNGYTGTVDGFLSELYPYTPSPEYPNEIMVDSPYDGGSEEQGLLRFDDIFGNGLNQIPMDTKPEDILEAKLFLHQNVITGNVEVYVHRMLGLWSDSDTWYEWGDGISPHNSEAGIQEDDYEAVAAFDYFVPATDQNEVLQIDVTLSLKAWLNGDDNYGWVLLPGMNSPAGRRFAGSEWDEIEMRPKLEVTLKKPKPVANAGGPYIVHATSWDGAYVGLDGTDSNDPAGGALTYEWDLDLLYDSDGDGEPNNDVDANEPMPESFFPIGQTEISLVVTNECGLKSQPDVTTVTVSFIEVDIDIKPGSFPNAINMGSHGVIPVAFLSDEDFDASTVDPATVTLRGEDFTDGLVKLRGKKDAPVPMSNLEDIDNDGDLDLVVHLETEKLAVYELDAICEIGALTFDGYVVSGSDTIKIVQE